MNLRTLSVLLLAACAVPGKTPGTQAVQTVPPAPLPFAADLLAVAAAYPQWHRVSDRANFAPTDCRIPAPAGAQRSQAIAPGGHGQKLYFLFAQDSTQYFMLPTGDGTVPVGQAVVKQSFHAVEVAKESVPELAGDGTPFARRTPAEYRIEGDRAFRTGEPYGLFVMLKKAPDTPGTDQGWVYGTLTADGKSVTAAGCLPSCIECHRSARYERLFGMHPRR